MKVKASRYFLFIEGSAEVENKEHFFDCVKVSEITLW